MHKIYTVPYGFEQKKEPTSYYAQCTQSILSLSHNCVSRISFFLLLNQHVLRNGITTLSSIETTDNNSLTCGGEISDDSSVDSDEDDTDCEIESHAALKIQGVWCRWIKIETLRRYEQHELKSRSCQIIINSWRTGVLKQKVEKEESAALIIQDAWLSWIIAEKQRRQTHDEDLAVTMIQLGWRKYQAQVALEEKEATITCYQNMAYATGLTVFYHVFLHTFISH